MSEPFVLPPAPEVWTREQYATAALGTGEQPPTRTRDMWLDGRIEHLSASGIRLLKVCPEAWRHRYVLHEKERPGEGMTMGNAVHGALKHTHTQKITSGVDLPVVEVIEYFHDKAWPETIENDGGVDNIRWDDGNKPDDVRRDGERVTRAYHTVVSPKVQPLKVEQKFEYRLDGVPVPIIGYVDVEEENDIIDVKTGKSVQRKVDGHWATQGGIYSMVLNKPAHFHSISRAQTPSIATPLTEGDTMVVTPAQVQHLKTVLRDFAAQIEWYYARHGPDEPWPTTGILMDYRGGRACNYCGYRKDCIAWAHERIPA